MSIGTLCDAYLPADGEGTAPVGDGIDVPCFDRETHELTWQPVTHAIRHETEESTYEITTQKGRTVEVTGNHSIFTLNKDGETQEVAAGDLEPGDTLLTPRRLPQPAETTEAVNLLEHITADQLEGRRCYVYGFEREQLETLRSEETVRKKPTPDSNRERYYYVHEGVEILRDSFETNYIEDGYLPAETVLELGWEQQAADCELVTYQVGGEETAIPVTLPADEQLVKLVAYYISEGHADDRQVGFTFGSHESELIESTEQAVAAVGGTTTTVAHDRNSTRVKAFGSPLAMFLHSACGDGAQNKRIPSFVFELDAALQQQFIAALYQGDGSDSHPSNELSHTTTSETLARQLSVLWNMHGVLASTEIASNSDGYADGDTEQYRTKVYGGDTDLADIFAPTSDTSEQTYKRIPTSLLDDVRVGQAGNKTVPDTVPGLLMAAGVGSKIDHAQTYAELIEAAVAGEYVDKPRYSHNLKQWGLLDDDHQPTDQLTELWSTVQNLQGFTETDMCLLPVESVIETDSPEYVYDISVPGATGHDENFVVCNDGALSVKNSRGQQGIGISAAVLYSQLTSGKPAKITSRTQEADQAEYFELIIDTDTNEPEIKDAEPTTWDRTHGTRIELEMEANMRARQQLHQYIKNTAVVNPHARIELREPGLEEPLKFERGTDQLPAETSEIRPHPHGVELGTLIKMLDATESYSVSGFLQEEFTRVGKKTADKVLDSFRDRHFGRELTWPTPATGVDIAGRITESVSNKGAEATEQFANEIEAELRGRSRTAYSELVSIVDDAAEAVEADTGRTFGSTVRDHAVEAAWGELTAFETDESTNGEAAGRDHLTPAFYRLIDEATSSRKEDETINALAERIARRATGREDPRFRLTYDELTSLVNAAADATVEYDDVTVGETARENIIEAVWDAAETVPDDAPKISKIAGNRDMASELLEAMRATSILSPPTDCLSPITAELVEAGLRKEYDADFYAASTRDAEVHGGDPFIVEAGIAYGGELAAEGKIDLLRFANRVPLVYQQGACSATDVVKAIGWRNYGLDQPGGSGLPNGPAVLMIHVASTNVPFTSESKDAIANIPEIEDEIELAIREAARELKSYLNKRRSLEKRQQKQSVLSQILPEMADKVAEVTGRQRPNIDAAMGRIMNNVCIDRETDGDQITLHVENYSDRAETPEITEIVASEPTGLSTDEASVVEVDGEWFIQWSPDLSAGEEAELTYTTAADAKSELTVEGVDSEKLTVNA